MFVHLPKFVQETIRSYLASNNFLAAKNLHDYYMKEGQLKTKHHIEMHKSDYQNYW